MKESTIKRLKVVQEECEMNSLKLGEYFLYGNKVIHQLEDKKPGDPITYYKVISKSERGVEYMPIYDYLDKD